jgi:hypothetical protein
MRLLVLHDHYALCLNVDPGPERLWKLSVPLRDLRPDGIAQLVLGVRSDRDFAVFAGEQEPKQSVTNRSGLLWLRIQAVCHLISEAIADPPP